MSTVILPTRPAARSLIVAPRLPAAPKAHTGDPFTTVGDVVADCTVEGCGWHAMGPRADVKKSIQAHHALHHPQDVVVTLLNNPHR